MNIFVLDRDIRRCAQAHCDLHVSKMVLESVQMLCTALNSKGFETPYRSTHAKHPCTLWVGDSFDNFQWLAELAVELNREFLFRYERDKDHASIAVLRRIENLKFERNGLTEFAQARCDQQVSSVFPRLERFHLPQHLRGSRQAFRKNVLVRLFADRSREVLGDQVGEL